VLVGFSQLIYVSLGKFLKWRSNHSRVDRARPVTISSCFRNPNNAVTGSCEIIASRTTQARPRCATKLHEVSRLRVAQAFLPVLFLDKFSLPLTRLFVQP
jgi:hypothetical protein